MQKALKEAAQGHKTSTHNMLLKAESYYQTPQVQKARGFINRPSTGLTNAQQALLDNAEKMQKARSLQKALDYVTTLTSQEPLHIPVLMQRAELKIEIEALNSKLALAKKYHQNKDNKKAVALINETLQQWPDFTEGVALSNQINARANKIAALLKQFNSALDAHEWRDASVTLSSMTMYDSDKERIGLLERTLRQKQVYHLLLLAERCVDQKRTDEAQKHYTAILALDSKNSAALEALTDLAVADAQELVRLKKNGDALLRLLKTYFDGVTSDKLKRNIAAVEKKIYASMQVPLAITTRAKSGEASKDSRLSAAYKAYFAREIPEITDFYSKKNGYRINVEVLDASTRKETLEEGTRTKEYTHIDKVKNTKLSEINTRLLSEKQNLMVMRQKQFEYCTACQGKKIVKCEKCSGHKKIKCKHCWAQRARECRVCAINGSFSCSKCKVSKIHCSHCLNKKGYVTCWDCSEGSVKCKVCKGAGKLTLIDSREINKQKYLVDDLEKEFKNAPAYLELKTRKYWKYDYKRVQQTTSLKLKLQLLDADNNEVFANTRYFSVKATDDSIGNPNPEIGLKDNTLSLPSSAVQADEVLKKAVESTGREMKKHLLKNEISRRNFETLHKLENLRKVEILLLQYKLNFKEGEAMAREMVK